MVEYHIPKGVSRGTLLDVIVGWYDAGAAGGPVNTADAAEACGHPDATGRQTKFLESVGVLAAAGRDHELTAQGADLAASLAAGEERAARTAFRELLSGWPLASALVGVVDERPLPEAELVEHAAAISGADLESDRERTGLRTLVSLLVWADALGRTPEGRYRVGEANEGEEALRVSLELSLDVNPEDVEGLLEALRTGLAADLDEDEDSLDIELDAE
jgi:hypothetical protein